MKQTVILQKELKSSPLGTRFTGNNKAVLLILLSVANRTVKVQGVTEAWGKHVWHYAIFEIRNQQLKSYVNYAPTDLEEYLQTKTDMVLRFDNVDTELIASELIRRKEYKSHTVAIGLIDKEEKTC